jgi:glutamate synthase (NADPH/NADH) large chain
VNFFEYIAEEVREHLAELGFRSLAEAVGHVELLDTREADRPLEGERPRPVADPAPAREPRRAGPALHAGAGPRPRRALDNELIAAARRARATASR